MNKKILFLDIDNVIVDFMSGVSKLEQEVLDAHKEIHGASNLDEIEGVFRLMDPLPGANDSDVLIRIASYFGQGMSKWNAAASAGIFENQEKAFNKNWKSLVEERKRMRGGR